MNSELAELEYEQFLDRVAEPEKVTGRVYLPLGQGRFAVVDSDCPFEILSQKWSANTKTPGRVYAYRTLRKEEGRGKTHLALHSQLTGAKELEVDHIDGDTLNNCKRNLRVCAHSQNGRNLRKWSSTTSSKYKGVSRRNNGKWQAYISPSGKQKYLGVFEAEVDAALAYNAAAREIFGEFAKLNVV